MEESVASSPIIAGEIFTLDILYLFFRLAFVTSQARLHLYTFLEELQTRAIYYDTGYCSFDFIRLVVVSDSVFYTTSPGEPEIPLSPFLGGMTDELREYGPDAYISSFVAAGEKGFGKFVKTFFF